MSLGGHSSVLAAIIGALDALSIRYFVGGSFASIVFGELRTTQDVDIVVELEERHVAALIERLSPEFFVDEDFLRDAIRRRSSCNLIHRTTGFKVDLFLRRDRDFSRAEMERARTVELAPSVRMRVASAEDCVLSKLEWYEKGGQVSDRQWRDVLGVIKEQGASLDLSHLQDWARKLGLVELLARALREAGIPPP